MTLNRKKGLALIETIVYLAVLAVIFVLVINTVLVITSSSSHFQVARDINRSAIISLERITRDLRNSINVNTTTSTLGIHPGWLVFNHTDSFGNPTTTEFYLGGTTLKVREGVSDTGDLTLSTVRVTNLVFWHRITGQSEAVTVEMELESGTGAQLRSSRFYSTVVLRNSY